MANMCLWFFSMPLTAHSFRCRLVQLYTCGLSVFQVCLCLNVELHAMWKGLPWPWVGLLNAVLQHMAGLLCTVD